MMEPPGKRLLLPHDLRDTVLRTVGDLHDINVLLPRFEERLRRLDNISADHARRIARLESGGDRRSISFPPSPSSLANDFGLQAEKSGSFRVSPDLLDSIARKLAEQEAKKTGAEEALERVEKDAERLRRAVTFWVGLAVVGGGFVSWLLSRFLHF